MKLKLRPQPNQLEAVQATGIQPEYAEMRYITAKYGLGRGKLFELIKTGQIVAKHVITKGRKRGRILINVSLLEHYLSRLPNM